MADLITQADLELRYKPRQVRDAACDDGSGTAGASLASAISTASRVAVMTLARGGWDEAGVVLLVAGDDDLKTAVCDIAMYELTKRNLAWLSANGGPPLRIARDDAVKLLNDVADANLRPGSETSAGANKRYRDRMSVNTDPQYMFAPSRGNPRPGGY